MCVDHRCFRLSQRDAFLISVAESFVRKAEVTYLFAPLDFSSSFTEPANA